MKTKLMTWILPLCLMAGAWAQSRGTQLGVILMGPTGLSAKFWLTSNSALDAALTGRAAEEGSTLYLHMDYLRHLFGKIQVEGGELPIFWGFGGKVLVADGADPTAGLRIPLGVSYIYGENFFDLFFEMVPFVDLFPDRAVSIDGAVGFRVFF